MPEGNAIVKSNKKGVKTEAQKATERWLRQAYKEHGSTEGDQLELRRRKATAGIKAMEAFISEVEEKYKDIKGLTNEQHLLCRQTLYHMMADYWQTELLAQLVDNLSARFVAKGRRTAKKGYVRVPASLYLDNIWNESAMMRRAMEKIAEMPDEPDTEEEPIEVDDDEIYDEKEHAANGKKK